MQQSPRAASRNEAPVLRRGRVALALAAMVAFSCAVRILVALGDAGFSSASVEGLLRSDPALLYYFTERIVDADGGLPADFRADPRVAWPARVDLPATFTVGQEFLVAWVHLATGREVPLHLCALAAMAATASAAAAGAYLLARELADSRAAGLFAAALWCLLPASYRTVGFLLVREDLAFPLFALHLGLLAGALRRPSPTRFAGAGLALAAALATWHAMGFFVALEAAAFALRFLATGRNPFAARGAGWIALPALAACALVPVLRATWAVLAPALVAGAALWAAARVARRGRLAATAAFLAILVAGLALRGLLGKELGDYAHVSELLLAKLRWLGRPPVDPRQLSFDARLLWQGPFETLAPGAALRAWGVALVAPVVAVAWLARRGAGSPPTPWSGRDSRAVLAVLALLALPAAWLVARVAILAGLAFAALLGVALATRRRLALAALGAQAVLFAHHALTYGIPWYGVPGRQEELALLVRALPGLVPEGEAVAADFVSSTAVLAHTYRPILYQPKYETDASRRRIEEFLETFYLEPPEALRALLVEEYRCRHLLVDRSALGYGMRYLAGLAPGEEPPPGSAAARFLSQDEAELRSVPGFELLYRSPPTVLQANGRPYDLFRLYRLGDGR